MATIILTEITTEEDRAAGNVRYRTPVGTELVYKQGEDEVEE